MNRAFQELTECLQVEAGRVRRECLFRAPKRQHTAHLRRFKPLNEMHARGFIRRRNFHFHDLRE